jgi:Ni,Fe-hydrogenase I large subunit
MSDQIEINIPSSEEHRKEIFAAIEQMSNSLTRMKGESDYIKETKKFIKETYEIDPKWISKTLKDFHEDKFDKTVKEFEEYEAFYETIVKMKNNSEEKTFEEFDD